MERTQLATTPTSKERSAHWFFRVDGEKEFLRQKCEELSQCIDVEACLAAYHTGKTKENPHAHVCISLTSTPQKQSFAVRIKQLFRVEKKSQYALSVWDNDREKGATSYVYHEEDAIIFCTKGFTQAQLDAAQIANAAVQKVVNLNKERAEHKLVERALKEFENAQPTRLDILEFMLTCIKNGDNYHPGTFMLKRYVEEVELKLLPAQDLREYAALLENNLWR